MLIVLQHSNSKFNYSYSSYYRDKKILEHNESIITANIHNNGAKRPNCRLLVVNYSEATIYVCICQRFFISKLI